jgi:hypothetical protein
VRAYTFRGDVLANSYLRKTLINPYDILNSIRGDATVPFAYQIYDNYDFLVSKGLSMPAKETLMMTDGITIHNDNIKKLYLDNFDYFLRLPNLYTLMKAFCRELLHIIQKAPRAHGRVIVYRGVKDESYMTPRTAEYVNTSFQSTTLNPSVALGFTKKYFNTPIRYCVYEMNLNLNSPCLYISPVSQFQSEYEILLPYNLRYMLSVDIRLKHSVTPVEGTTADGMEYDTVARTGRVFVRNIDVVGFSGSMDPRQYGVNALNANNKKTLKSRAKPNVRVNSAHNKTLRRGNYGKTVNMLGPYNFGHAGTNEE